MRKIHSYIFIIAALVGAAALFVSAESRSPARLKARYYYLEGLKRQTEESSDEAYEFFRKAMQADPSYPEAASAFATMRLTADLDTLRTRTELARSLGLMRPMVDRYPDDYNEAVYYAYVASHSDSVKEAIRVFERTARRRPEMTSALVLLSEAYMADGNIPGALDALSRYETIEGKDPQITIKKITYQLARRDTVAALDEATSLVESNRAEPSYLILKGNMFEMMGMPDSTFHYFSQAERLNPDYGAAKLALADYYRQQGDSLSYDAKTYEALLSEDFGLEQKLSLLEEYLQKLFADKNDTSRGDHLFSVLREQYPHEPQLLDLSARFSAAKGNFREAEEEIRYAIDLTPSEEKYRSQLMTYLVADDRPEEAEKVFREMESLIPVSRNSLVLAASASQMAGHYPQAIAAYERVAKDIAPEIPLDRRLSAKDIPASVGYDDLQRLSQVYSSIGDCLYADKKLDKAYEAYDNALLLMPDNALALNNYAYFLAENDGDLARAEEMSRRSLEGENADNPTFLDTYAWILYRLGDYAEAHKYQAAAVEAAENREDISSELYDHFADILSAEGNTEEAAKYYEKALSLDSDNKDIAAKLKGLNRHPATHKTQFNENK